MPNKINNHKTIKYNAIKTYKTSQINETWTIDKTKR